MTESDLIFLVTIANLPALRNSQRCLELFDKLGFDSSKTQLLLNRYMENDEVSEKVKLNIASILFEKYGIVEEDFQSPQGGKDSQFLR